MGIIGRIHNTIGVSFSHTDRRCGGVRQGVGANLVRLECKAFSIGGSNADHALSGTPRGKVGFKVFEYRGKIIFSHSSLQY